jgi:hypothetical protein
MIHPDMMVSIFHFKSINFLILLLQVLHLTFVFETCTFDIVAPELNFTLTALFSSNNHLVAMCCSIL